MNSPSPDTTRGTGQELNHTGQLIANQLAPATEYGVTWGNSEVLESLLKATLSIAHVRSLEIQDNANQTLAYIEKPSETDNHSQQVIVYQAPIRQQRVRLSDVFLQDTPRIANATSEHYLGRVIVGMSNGAFSLSQPIRAMGDTLKVNQPSTCSKSSMTFSIFRASNARRWSANILRSTLAS